MANMLVLFSGGRTSAMMAKLISVSKKYEDWNIVYVFANTGKEREETLDFVHKCDVEFNLNLVWIESIIHPNKGEGIGYKIVDYKSANRNGNIFEAMIRKYGIPSKGGRDCTKYLKERSVHKFAKVYFDHREKEKSKYYTATGIRADETHRISSDPRTIHPLVEFNIDESFVRGWWKKQSFDLKLKDYEGNCDLCFLKSTRKRLSIIAENPQTAVWWQEMEERYSNELKPMFDVYRNLRVEDLVLMAKDPFKKAVDKQELRDGSPKLFEPEFDLEFDCYCKEN